MNIPCTPLQVSYPHFQRNNVITCHLTKQLNSGCHISCKTEIFPRLQFEKCFRQQHESPGYVLYTGNNSDDRVCRLKQNALTCNQVVIQLGVQVQITFGGSSFLRKTRHFPFRFFGLNLELLKLKALLSKFIWQRNQQFANIVT